MLFLLSPAKALDYDSPLAGQQHTAPLFVAQSQALIEVLRTYAPQQIATLMDLSDKLSALNVARYEAWSPQATVHNARQAVLAFDGDVYGGLSARTLSAPELDWAQQHLCILSGLYGVLRPLDLMQPYRLEMGTRLPTAQGKDLYQFWKTTIAAYLNERLQAEAQPVVVNLASQEYFKAVHTPSLKAQVVECVFQQAKAGQYKVISFLAKRARGLMARYAVEHRITKPQDLRSFDAEGYAWDAQFSTPERLVFKQQPPSGSAV